jgi:hypothetical protein
MFYPIVRGFSTTTKFASMHTEGNRLLLLFAMVKKNFKSNRLVTIEIVSTSFVYTT